LFDADGNGEFKAAIVSIIDFPTKTTSRAVSWRRSGYFKANIVNYLLTWCFSSRLSTFQGQYNKQTMKKVFRSRNYLHDISTLLFIVRRMLLAKVIVLMDEAA